MNLDPARLAASLAGLVEVHAVLESTQSRARELARGGAAHGTAVFAERQRAGRGRLGRVWESGPSVGLLTTLVLRPEVRAVDAPRLCLAAAVGVAEAIEATRRSAGPRYGIKWPNDVLAPDGRKVAGILAEADPGPEGRLRYALIGVGLNVHGAPPLPTAACLDEVEGTSRDRHELAVALVTSVVRWTDALARDPSSVLDRFRRDQITLGRDVRVGDVRGTAVAVEDSGALVVRDARGGVHRITTGDVEMIRASSDSRR